MADASYTQTSFLGGEISQWAQGQFDKPYYKMALNKAFNIWPTDEGSAPRRPGFRFLGATNKGDAGRLIAFDFSQATPYNLEITDNLIRMWNNTNLVTTNDNQQVESISNDTNAVFTLGHTVNWQTNDTVYFTFTSAQAAFAGNVLLNRQCLITMLNATQFTATDAVNGHVIGSIDAVAGLRPVVNHAVALTTNYSVNQNDWHSLRFVQGYNVATLLHTSVAPQALSVITPPTETTFATFAYGPAPFQDGPYLDPPPTSVATPSSLSTVFQLTVGYAPWATNTAYAFGVAVTYSGLDYVSLNNNNINNTPNTSPSYWQALTSGSMVNSGQGFLATDIGRMIRLFSQPQIWLPGTTYASGDSVTYNGSYFVSLAGSNTGNQPDISTTQWVINPSGAIWTWGTVIAVSAANNVTVQLQGAPLLYQSIIYTWRLGAWSNTTGWPTCGVYHEGRFWYAGAVPNRVDSSQPNQPFNMAPTAQDGTVVDNNGISYTFNASEQNPFFWGIPDHQGVIWGTQEGEWLMTSGTTGAPITPSNIQAHRETKYGGANILPVRTGLTICFVKRYSRRIMEYLADVLSGRFFGNDLTKNARHLGARGIEEIDFQEELIPTLWGRCANGSLIGTTYRRSSLFSNQEAEFNAWHQHALGSGRLVESISVGPSVDGSLDALSLITNDPSTNIHYVEQMTTLLDETAPITQSWYLDTAVTPQASAANINALFGSGTVTAGNVLDTGLFVPNDALYEAGMRPLIASGSSLNVNQVWVGGVTNLSGGTAAFKIEKVDVTASTPVILNTYTSGTFSLTEGSDPLSWALDPTGRYIAMYAGDGGASANATSSRLVIFDTQTLTFGTILNPSTVDQLVIGGAQIVWLDTTHLTYQAAVYDSDPTLFTWTGRLGVEVFSVSGTTITHVGFTALYGSHSVGNPTGTNNKYPLGYANMVPNPSGSGVINLIAGEGSSGTDPTTFNLYGTAISWQSGSLVVGSLYTIATNLAIGTIDEYNIVQTNTATGEWTFCGSGGSYYYLMSFTLTTTGSSVIRPWQRIVYSFNEAGESAKPVYFAEANNLIMLENNFADNNYSISTLHLDSNSFTPILMDSDINIIAGVVDWNLLRLDSQRFLVTGTLSSTQQLQILSDPPVTPSYITFYTLEPFNGRTVSVFAAGIDCGDYVVVNGQVSVPIGTVDPETGWVFNEQAFQTLQPLFETFQDLSVPVLYAGKTYNIPCVIGFNYKSQGQLCRPQMPVDTGAKNGPGFGKKRKSTRYAAQLVNSVGVYAGTNLDKTKQMPLTKIDAGGKKLNYLDTFTGIIRETLDDSHSYDSMLAWEIKRPYPATITAIGAFIETTDV